LAGLFVGTTLGIIVKLGGPKSGACYNTAVGLAMVILDPDTGKKGSKGDRGEDLILYIVFTLLGGVLAGLWTRFVHLPSVTDWT
jgi:glycerol uptake facilitator-like aquaporin